MTRLLKYSRSILASLLLGMLVACVPAPPATQSFQDVENEVATIVAMTVEAQAQIATSVAQTVEAQNALTQAAQPTPTLVPTLEPPTMTPIPLPTATPFVAPPPPSGGGGGGGGTSSTPEYDCQALRDPADNTVFRKGNEFDIKWTIKNTGTKTWAAGLDLVYSTGPDLTKNGVTFVELPQVKVGETFTVILDAKVHNSLKPGTNTMVWKLQGGFCFPYISIIVE